MTPRRSKCFALGTKPEGLKLLGVPQEGLA